MKKIIRATTVPQSLEAFCKGMLKELSKDYEVLALSSPGEVLNKVGICEGVRTIGVPMARRISVLRDCESLWRMCRVFRKEKPDMVHSMTPKAGLICMVAARLTCVPIRIHTFTGLVFPTSTGLKRKLLMLTDIITCACATHIIPEGEGIKRDLIDNKITQKELKVLGYGNVRGVDLVFYNKTPEVESIAAHLRNPNKFTFVFVGRIVRDKGIDELIIAFKRLYQEFSHIRLFLVGPYEDELDPINAASRETIETCDDILSVGEKTGADLVAYYAASDCFVLPSYREGFPNTVLEAGALGLPCIVTDINGSREIIKNEYNGLVIPSQSSDALYHAMKRMVIDKTLRDDTSSVARAYIGSHFEQSFVRNCLYSYYKKILRD